ncbi:hypothetical protein AMAG_10950 [Allomyces macrogynus ATCC 38327]|uniref:Chloride channel protein n=1 Tax=Allomyces macrogynus (strain ATCC 38327) TaxID=578462 RepID=A0A0L0SS14_ALLM3|nr:hypothetical protein AMAG_10950 [Allomyces macrogynus ATCC 38327]|eukprot:KNE65307.1 hypothetical protein AMAG_10950 [Allomyces macrogynus ATCC 38327]
MTNSAPLATPTGAAATADGAYRATSGEVTPSASPRLVPRFFQHQVPMSPTGSEVGSERRLRPRRRRGAVQTWKNFGKRQERTKLARSVDIEDVDSGALRRYQDKLHPNRQLLVKIVLCVVLGFATSGMYYLMHHYTIVINDWRVKKAMALYGTSFVSFWGFLVGVALVAGLITAWISIIEPSAAGSGMPEVISYLNGLERPSYISFRTLIAKLIGMTLITSSGIYSGYDGPLIHTCAILGIVIIRNLKKIPFFAKAYYGVRSEQWTKETLSLIRIKRSQELQVFATLGAACGVATAFQAPLAGVAFALEEAVSFYDPSLILKTLFACSISLLATSLFYGGKKQNGNSYSVYLVNAHCDLDLNYADYLTWVIVGILGGVLGHLYNLLVAKISQLRAKHIQTSIVRRIIEVILVVVISMTATAFLIQVPTQSDNATCTPFDRSLKHLTKIPDNNKCTYTCGDLGLATTATTTSSKLRKRAAAESDDDSPLNECIKWFDEHVCVDARIRNMVVEDITTKYADAPSYCAGKSKSYKYSFLVETTAAVHDLVASSISEYKSALYPKGLFFDGAFNKTFIEKDDYDADDLALHKRAAAKPLTEPKCYHQMASLFMNQPENILNNLFTRGYYYLFEWRTLLIFGSAYLVLSLATHNISAPTDLVIPGLIVGAAFGRLYALGVNILRIKWGLSLMDPGAMALIGTAAFWSGTSRLIVTIIVIALQSTNEQTYLNGVTMVVIIAAAVGNALGESQYHLEIEGMEMAFLPHTAPHELAKLTVADRILEDEGSLGPENLASIPLEPEFTVQEALYLLKSNQFSGFPVLHATKQTLHGSLLRDQLLDLINQAVERVTGKPVAAYSTIDRKQRQGLLRRVFGGRKTPANALSTLVDRQARLDQSANELDHLMGALVPEVLQQRLDEAVKEVMNRSPRIVYPDTSASKAYMLFRGLGVRHLLVVDHDNVAVGMLTRSDFHAMVEEAHHGGHGHGHGHGGGHDAHGNAEAGHAPTDDDVHTVPRSTPAQLPASQTPLTSSESTVLTP